MSFMMLNHRVGCRLYQDTSLFKELHSFIDNFTLFVRMAVTESDFQNQTRMLSRT